MDAVHLLHSPTLSLLLSSLMLTASFLNLFFHFHRVPLYSPVLFQTLNLSSFPIFSFFYPPPNPPTPHSLCIHSKRLWHKWAINYALPQSIINQSQLVNEPQACQPPGRAVHVSLCVSVCLSLVYLNSVCCCVFVCVALISL